MIERRTFMTQLIGATIVASISVEVSITLYEYNNLPEKLQLRIKENMTRLHPLKCVMYYQA